MACEIRTHLPNALSVYAFGSQATGTTNAESDLNLAVLVAGYAQPLVLWDLAHRLGGITRCPVDLLDLRATSTVMQYQVITTGHLEEFLLFTKAALVRDTTL